MKGVIPTGRRKKKWGRTDRGRGSVCCNRARQGGKGDKSEQIQREKLLSKHLGTIREPEEKRWNQLKISAPLTALLSYSPASYSTNTFLQRHK